MKLGKKIYLLFKEYEKLTLEYVKKKEKEIFNFSFYDRFKPGT